MSLDWMSAIIDPFWLDRMAQLMDTYWPFLLAALIIGIITGWIAAQSDAKSG